MPLTHTPSKCWKLEYSEQVARKSHISGNRQDTSEDPRRWQRAVSIVETYVYSAAKTSMQLIAINVMLKKQQSDRCYSQMCDGNLVLDTHRSQFVVWNYYPTRRHQIPTDVVSHCGYYGRCKRRPQRASNTRNHDERLRHATRKSSCRVSPRHSAEADARSKRRTACGPLIRGITASQ
jgi:hypothetical protein